RLSLVPSSFAEVVGFGNPLQARMRGSAIASRRALTSPACGERSEFARSSRKFRVRGPLRSPSLEGESEPAESLLTPSLSPLAARGSTAWSAHMRTPWHAGEGREEGGIDRRRCHKPSHDG